MTSDPVEGASAEQLGGLVLSVSLVTGLVSQSVGQSVTVCEFGGQVASRQPLVQSSDGGGGKVRGRGNKRDLKRSASLCFLCFLRSAAQFRTASRRSPAASWIGGRAAPRGGQVGGPSCR